MAKYIVTLNNGLKFTTYKLPEDDGFFISFHDRDGLFKKIPKAKFEPLIEEVRE